MPHAQNRSSVILTALLAIAFLGIAVWTLAQDRPLEAAGYSLVATLAVLAALLTSNPERPRAAQRRLFITAMMLVPITLFILIASIVV